MRLWTMVILAMAAGAAAAAPPATLIAPFESDAAFEPVNPIDECVLRRLQVEGIAPAPLCSDAVFVRRVYFDAIGTLPTAEEARGFIADRGADKRARLIDALLTRPEFADYWSLKWCDVLRVKSEFPINLWPNAVQAYQRWVREALASNMPYDEFARALLTSSGSNFRVPPVNFYRGVQGKEPNALAAAVALTFMGSRFESWPEARRAGMAAFFSRVAFKGTAEWKEEIVYLDPAAEGPLRATFPDGRAVTIPAGRDPRAVFADWLTTSENPWFARAIANRIWAWLVGRGVVHEPDDLRPDNSPSNPELLAYLAAEVKAAGFDLRHLMRLILNSRTYQQSSIARSDDPRGVALFAAYPVRRHDAEVLIDAINAICGGGEDYASMIPEPFTFIPESNRSITLADGSITSPFLEMFGRPARDSGLVSERNNQPTGAQRLYLLNASQIHNKINGGPKLRELLRGHGRDHARLIREIYFTVLSRAPTAAETAAIIAHAERNELSGRDAAVDLVWALLNSKEFLCRH